jgi:hypothetical protein
LVEHEVKRLLEIPRHRGEDDIETEPESVDWNYTPGLMTLEEFCEHDHEFKCFIK